MCHSRFSDLVELTLGGCTLVHNVDVDTVLELSAGARWRRLKPGDALVRIGDALDHCVTVTSGDVRFKHVKNGRSVEFDAGATYGLRTLFRGAASTFDTIALTKVVAAEISRDAVLAAMARSAPFAQNVTYILTTPTAHIQARQCLDKRIAETLATSAGRPGPDGLARLKLKPDVAAWSQLLDVEAADVRRSLVRLERVGILVACTRGRLAVDLARLRAWKV